jgi:hypothetical protein
MRLPLLSDVSPRAILGVYVFVLPGRSPGRVSYHRWHVRKIRGSLGLAGGSAVARVHDVEPGLARQWSVGLTRRGCRCRHDHGDWRWRWQRRRCGRYGSDLWRRQQRHGRIHFYRGRVGRQRPERRRSLHDRRRLQMRGQSSKGAAEMHERHLAVGCRVRRRRELRHDPGRVRGSVPADRGRLCRADRRSRRVRRQR